MLLYQQDNSTDLTGNEQREGGHVRHSKTNVRQDNFSVGGGV